MRRLLIVFVLPLLLSAPSSRASQAHPAEGVSRNSPALERFKSLAGDWEGKDGHGNALHVNYEVLDTGVVMERVQTEGQSGMMTMYSLDGDHIVAIHFCSAGNQPILKTGPLKTATGKYEFVLERTYGLRNRENVHMVALLMMLDGKDHLTQAWTSLDHGKRSTTTLTFERKKS